MLLRQCKGILKQELLPILLILYLLVDLVELRHGGCLFIGLCLLQLARVLHLLSLLTEQLLLSSILAKFALACKLSMAAHLHEGLLLNLALRSRLEG